MWKCLRRKVTQLYILGTIRYDILTTPKKVHLSLLTACTVIANAHSPQCRIKTVPGVSPHLALWTEVPVDLTPHPHHFQSVMHETGGSKTRATSPCPQNPFGTTNVLVREAATASEWPGVMRRCSPPLPFSEIGTLLLPGESKLPENGYFLS